MYFIIKQKKKKKLAGASTQKDLIDTAIDLLSTIKPTLSKARASVTKYDKNLLHLLGFFSMINNNYNFFRLIGV